MPFQLRLYQQAAVNAGVLALRGSVDAGLLVEPVGSGKSLVIASIVTQLDAPALVFQPTKEILEQNAAKFLDYGYTPQIYSASMREKSVGQITLATIGSAIKHIDLFSDVRYVIVDECDLVSAKGGMYAEFLASIDRSVRVLGLTATPFRLVTDGYKGAKLKFLTRTRPRIFTDVVHYTQIADLMRQKFLVPLVYHHVPGFDASRVMLNTTGADFDDLSVQRHFDVIRFRDKLRKVVERLHATPRKHILVFVRYVEDAEVLAYAVPGVHVITGETPATERATMLAAFRAGEIRTVANIGVLVAGFDFPSLDTVVLAAPTRSLRRYIQQVGRVVRPAQGKREGWVVDMVGLIKEFGRVEDLRLEYKRGRHEPLWEFRSRGRPLTNVYLRP